MALLRLARILWIGLRFRLYRFLPQFSNGLDDTRAVHLRQALEALGPIFVKFGQVLSTRRDLLPADIADELAKLQDQVPPFDSALAVCEVERSLGKPIAEAFRDFGRQPVASASVAQVHFATLLEGTEVAVKVLRPGVERAIARDVLLLQTAAGLMEGLWAGERIAAAAQFRELAPARGAGDSLGLLFAARDGDGANAWHADITSKHS